MRLIECHICDTKNIPMNDTIKVDGKVNCANCFETNFLDQKDLEGKLVEKDKDPTICTSCNKDFEDNELRKIANHPICDSCEIEIKNKTFPLWVKGFFIGILVIVLGSFFWNWKYYQAYHDIKQANEFFQKQDYAKATLLMNNASNKVPEVEDLTILSIYFHGLELLSKDKSAEALVEFNKCKYKAPPEFQIKSLILQAKIGATFDNKDYKGFLEASKENLALDYTQAVSLTSVASAYACIYAQEGNDTTKQNAILYLNKAKAIDDTSKTMKDYYNMVEYRIASRKIIPREEFINQFPNGWSKN